MWLIQKSASISLLWDLSAMSVLKQTIKLSLYMILTTPFCPYGPAMIEMTRKKAEGALNRPTLIELGMEMWDFSMMEEGATPEWGMW